MYPQRFDSPRPTLSRLPDNGEGTRRSRHSILRAAQVSRSPYIGSEIDITVDGPFRAQVPETWLCSAVEAALRVALPEGNECQVSLVITDDEAVRRLNRDYRGLDEVTDVLSFSASNPGHWEGEGGPIDGRRSPGQGIKGEAENESPFVYPPGEPVPLGDVVICYPQAQRQATERGVPVDREMALLIVHGVLHLVGHDHLEPDEESDMQAKEQSALSAIPGLNIAHAGTVNR